MDSLSSVGTTVAETSRSPRWGGFFPFAGASASVKIHGGIPGKPVENPPVASSKAVGAPNRAWTGKSRGGYAGYWIFLMVLRFLGLRAGYLLLVFVAFYFFLFAPKTLKASMEYLRRQFKCGLPLCLLYAYRHIFSFGQLLVDRAAIVANPARFKLEEEGLSHILDAVKANKGLVLLGAHVGGWETAMSFLAKRNVVVNVVMFEGEEEKVRRLLEKNVRMGKVKLLSVSGSPEDSLAAIAALRRGEVVAMHGDRTLGGRTVAVPFLGAPATFPLWPYALAAAAKAPLIHTFAARAGIYHYRFKAWPAANPRLERSGSEKEPLRKFAQDFVSHLEEFVRDYPFQWFNFYPFWKQE
jgi:predicted LPLAT superfamily acyltransferase